MSGIDFKGRTVVITGGGGGLGRTYALDIARRGGAVVVNDLGGNVDGDNGSHTMADQVVSEIVAAGGRAIANYDSVATRAGGEAIVQAALDAFGRIDAVINNAGNLRNAWIEDLEDEDRDAILSVHLLGTFNVTRAAWPHLKAQGYGRVVFTSSASGMLGNAMQGAYGAAKGGIVGLMNVVSQEGAPHNILCNALTPNAETRMADKMDADAMKDIVPYMGEIGGSMQREFNTGMAVYLASETCISTHSIYSMLGGRYARMFIGVTEGWQASRETPPSAEDIAAHIDQIRDPRLGYYIPDSLIDEYRIVATKPEALGGR
jgi:NAD(P)-dependent dehydrogenase (short-subunit alcohol dehydrogenase family)